MNNKPDETDAGTAHATAAAPDFGATAPSLTMTGRLQEVAVTNTLAVTANDTSAVTAAVSPSPAPSPGELRAQRLAELHTFRADPARRQDVVQGASDVLLEEPTNATAIGLLESVLYLAGQSAPDPAISPVLIAAYRASSRWAELVVLLDARVNQLETPAARLAARKEIAALRLTRLGDAAGAYTDWELAFRDDPSDASLRLELERSAEAAGRWAALAEAYASALSNAQSADYAAPLRLKLAWLLDEKLHRGTEAIEHYRALAPDGHWPTDVPTLETLARLLRPAHREAELAQVLDLLAIRLPPEQANHRHAVWLELGKLYENSLGDSQRAIATYQAIVQADPRAHEPLRSLATLLTSLGDDAALAPVLDRLIELGPVNSHVVEDALLRAQAVLRQGNVAEAIKSFRFVLSRRREHPEALAGLEALLERAADPTEIIGVLEPVFLAQQDYVKLAWVLEHKLERTTDMAARKAQLRRLGDIFENRLQQKDRAFMMARQALATDPADMGVRMWIEKLAAEIGANRELAEAFAQEAVRVAAPLNLQFWRRAAALYHEKLDDLPAAVQQYQAILVTEPADEKALAGLEAVWRSLGDSAALAEVLLRRLSHTAGLERRREMLSELTTLYEEKLLDPAAALVQLHSLLTLLPDDAVVFARIEKLLAQMNQYDELLAFLAQELARLTDRRGKDAIARRLEVTFRRGLILDTQMHEREQAAAVFAAILAEDVHHASTLQYLQARSAQGNAEAIAVLQTVWRQAKNWPAYSAVLKQKLEMTVEVEQRYAIHLELAQTYDVHLHDGPMALGALTRAMGENRADLTVLQQLEDLAQKYDLNAELVDILSAALETLPDVQLRHPILHRLAHICGYKLARVDAAIGYLQNALQHEPSDEPTLEALAALMEKNAMWAGLAEVLERRVEVAANPADKSMFLQRLAHLWADRLMDPEAALLCHRQILAIDPNHPLTLQNMQQLYEAISDWDALAQNLLRQAEVFAEPAEQARIHSALGRLYAEEFNDNGRAIKHWLQVLVSDHKHAPANGALALLLASEERWEELATLYREQLTYTPDPADKLDINRRLGIILGDKLGRRDDALLSWQKVLEQDPKSVDALRALMLLFGQRAQWQDYAAMTKRLIALVDGPGAKELRFALAQAYGENLGAREDAIRLAREVRATEPHTIEQMVRLGHMLLNIEAWDEAVLALEKAAGLETNVPSKVALYLQAAVVWRERLHRPNDARHAYEAILAAAPEHQEAFTALAQICRDTQNWRRLVVLCEECLPHAPQKQHLAILTEIRDVQQHRLAEKEQAFITGCRVLREAPEALDAADILETIAKEADTLGELTDFLADTVERMVDPAVKVATWRRIARLQTLHLHDTSAAEAALNRLLDIVPGDLQALDDLAALGAEQERYDKQIAALERKLLQTPEKADKKALLYEIATLYEQMIGAADQAVAVLDRVRQLDGADPRAIEEQARLYFAEHRWADLARKLVQQTELTERVADVVALRLRIASLYENELHEPESAITWYRGIVELEPANLTALGALERLYTRFERWSELIVVLEAQVQLAGDLSHASVLLTKMASLYEAEFSSPSDAAACFERILKLEPRHIPSIKELQRLLRARGDWVRLTEVLQHHISLLADAPPIAALYLEMGEIYAKELGRVDRAEQAYSKANAAQPNHPQALNALGRLYERSGNWFQALDMLQREADLWGATEAALPLLARMGRINGEMLGDREAATTAYNRALAIHSTFAPSLQALREMARQSEDWLTYGELLLRQAESTEDPEHKTELFCEAAAFYADIKHDDVAAIAFYQRALGLTLDHPDAARALAGLYFKAQRWAEARQMYLVVARSQDKSHDVLQYCQVYYRLGRACACLGAGDESLGYFKQAVDADVNYLPALEAYSQALVAAHRWEDALKAYQSLLIHHRDALTTAEVVEIQYQLGFVCLQHNQPERAYKQFEKVLELDATHATSLKALFTLELNQGSWEKAYAHMNAYADVAPGAERVPVLMHMSQMAAEHLGDMARSIETLERARRLGPPPLTLLEALAQAYLGVGHAANAVEVLEQAIALADNPTKTAALNFLLGQVYEQQLHQDPLAVQRYNDALDALPTHIEAFAAVERILAQRKEWVLLETNYRAMIGRAKDLSVATRVVLWRSLAELYRHVLKDPNSAIMAYEVISKIDPGKTEDLAALAELYGLVPANRHKAIILHHRLLATAANPVEHIRVLRRLYHAEADFDAVYALCSALAFLNQADAEEVKLLAYLARGVPHRASRGMGEDCWKMVLDPELTGPVGTLAAMLFRHAPDFITVPGKNLGLKKKELLDVRHSELYFANLVRYVAQIFTMPPVDVYRIANSMEGLRLAATQPPALVAGEANDIFRDAAQHVVLFHIGRNMAYARPELFVARAYVGAELRDVLLGLCVIYNRALQHNGDPREVARWAQTFEKLPLQVLTRLQAPAQQAFADLVAGEPLRRYAAAVERVAARAGLFAAGELAAAGKGLAEGGDGACPVTMRERLRDLALFSVSQDYLQVRKLLGAALTAQAAS